jgi:hypothetical protein
MWSGGAVGVSPLQAGIFGLMASFLTMALGHWIGLYAAATTTNCFKASRANKKHHSEIPCWWNWKYQLFLDPSFVSASLLGALCIMSLQEVWAAK